MERVHLTKVAFNCASLETLKRRLEARVKDGIVPLVTRYRPKRDAELVGGSLYWIIRQRIAARQTILGFDTRGDGKTIVCLDPELVTVHATAKRGHQGWRYLAAADAPPDAEEGDTEALPPDLAGKLAVLALI